MTFNYSDNWQIYLNNSITGASKQAPVIIKRCKYIPLFFSFDIETTNINELAFMWCWQFGFKNLHGDSNVIIGRHWCEFVELLDFINRKLNKLKCDVICYIANIGYEFQFMRKHVNISKFFAIKSRKPCKFNIERIEFRDALMISGRNLEHLAKNYTKTQKAVGDLDYTKIRNSKTPIDEKELNYICNDVIILCEFGEYIYKTYGTRGFLPLTKTSILRFDVKSGMPEQWKKKIKKIYVQDKDTYNLFFKYLFRGGYVHSNIYYTGDKLENLGGADYTSSYPFCMLVFKYPMSAPIKLNLKNINVLNELEKGTRHICFKATFINLIHTTNHSIESESKCIDIKGAIIDNGRVMRANEITVMLTELDYKIYKMFYKWDNMSIIEAWAFDSDYLPDYLLNPLKKYYEIKQTLKRTGKENSTEYAVAKEMVNSAYGMTVTKLNFENYLYINDQWVEKETNKIYAKMLDEQFLNCMWGIYVTAYARFNLLSCVFKIHQYVVYNDTDSIYHFKNIECDNMINEYNNSVDRILKERGIKFNDIGKFDKLKPIKYFKTLGAKRYIKTLYNGEFEQVIAGVPKGLLKKYCDSKKIDVYDYFENDMYIPELFEMGDETIKNKLRSKYIDDYTMCKIVDDFGNTEIMQEKSSLVLLNTDFTLTLSKFYLMLINSIIEEGNINGKREIY